MATEAPQYRSPTQTTAPVAGTLAGLWTIEEQGKARANRLLITNQTGGTVNVCFNGNTASDSVVDVALENRSTSYLIRAEMFGLNFFADVSIWVVTGADVSKVGVRCV